MGTKQVEIEIEQNAYDQINSALIEYGDYEIGGMLIGYKKGQNHFAISNATVADDFGSFNIASFVREPLKSMKVLLGLFRKRSHNYIGEWHSHPRFSLYPSNHDVQTMRGILSDPGYGVNFVLLIITKLNGNIVDMAGFLFHRDVENFIQASISNTEKSAAKGIDIKV